MRDVGLVLGGLVLALAGCSGCPSPGVGGGGGGWFGTGSSGGRDVVYASVVVEPQNVVLMTVAGAPVSQSFTLVGVAADQTRTAIGSAQWSLDSDVLGTINPQGAFTASGLAAGTVTVRGTYNPQGASPQVATTSVTVRLTQTVVVDGAPPDAPTQFTNATPATGTADRVELLYPLDRAVMPANVPAPHVQWRGGSAGDLFRITLSRPSITITAYTRHGGAAFTYAWKPERPVWDTVARSDAGAPLSIQVDRLHNGVLSPGAPVTVTLARGRIYGKVYYWQLEPGRILRLDAETGALENFMPDPPEPPTNGRHCVACHAISQNGRYLAGQLGEGTNREGTVFDLTQNLSGTPAPSLYPANRVNWGPASFNPDATRLVVSSLPGLGLVDPLNGMSINATGLPTENANHPAWSPDGNTIAYVGANTGWSWRFDDGDLMLSRRTGQDAFASPVRVVEGATLESRPEHGRAVMHPTWTPDSRRLAFSHGTQEPTPTASAVYLVAADGASLVRLDAAAGGAMATQAYWPTFSPFMTVEDNGEVYYWLAFYSRREYGNEQVGTRGDIKRQLWVTAVAASAAAGVDPSHVPYWLPGQDTQQENIAAYWATPACRPNTEGCTSDTDCCSGTCTLNPEMGGGQCETPTVGMCRREGETCGGTGDCCQGLGCTGNVCTPPTSCSPNGGNCTGGPDCCSGNCQLSGEGAPGVCIMSDPTMCRGEQQSCARDTDCCTSLLCIQGSCAVIGG
jgi:hypothetical protein